MVKHTAAAHARPVRLNWPFRTALACLVLSAVLLVPSITSIREMLSLSPVLARPVPVNVVGWALASIMIVVLLVFYRFQDRRLRSRSDYVLTRFANGRMVLTAIAGWLIGLVHAVFAATWWAS